MEPEMENTRPPRPALPTGKRELIFGALTLLLGIMTVNSVFFAGLNLGFAVFAGLALLTAVAYLMSRGGKLTGYSTSLLALSMIIIASFARGDDGFVKFVLFCFLLIAANLGLTLLAGKNRRAPGGLTSLLDVFRTIIPRTFGNLPKAFCGLSDCFKGSSAGKAGGALAIGLLVALPLIIILVALLISADAAFDGLLSLLPEWDVGEIIVSLIFGLGLGLYLYLRNTALAHSSNVPAKPKARKGIHALTVHTVLCAVCLVYVVYLVSQLAYFSGGFSGILPEEFTMAEYARRGFFEMAWICAINLAVIALAVGLVRKKEGKAPLLTKLLCLFIAVITLFLVFSASAKMFMYIRSFGLTRLRVLTEVIMVFLALATIFVCLWIFLPKLPYMKAVLVTALVMGGAVAWADVDTQVARYNVNAYQSGKLDTVDVPYLKELGNGALPYIARLTDDSDPLVAVKATRALHSRYLYEDFRDWNYSSRLAEEHVINNYDPPAGRTDFWWSYQLPGNYAIWKTEGNPQYCMQVDPATGDGQPVLELQVAALLLDPRFVGLECRNEKYEEPYFDYYLLDTVTGQLSEAMTQEEFYLAHDWTVLYEEPEHEWFYVHSDPDDPF